MTTRESLFTDLDRAELLALSLYRDGLCPLCGRPLSVCTADETIDGPTFTAAYTACRATLAIVEKQRARSDGGKKSDPYSAAYLWAATIRKR